MFLCWFRGTYSRCERVAQPRLTTETPVHVNNIFPTHAAINLAQSDVNNVNGFIAEDPSLEGLTLWKLMKNTEGSIFNNVAQARNASCNEASSLQFYVLHKP